MTDVGLPFNPLRVELYSPQELFAGFSLDDPDSYASCPDISILSYFWRYGTNPNASTGASTLEALHDNGISRATKTLLDGCPKVVAIMAGHGMQRGADAYRATASMAYQLAKAKFLMVSGGGPGGMEATHLGAAFASKSTAELEGAITHLAQVAPALPADAGSLVKKDGSIDPAIARELHQWLAPAIGIAQSLGDSLAPSFGIPTWLYGYEPSTPFASHHAKYFQNSIREDGLVTSGAQGIIYAQGSAGTVQEIFQDAAQNFYGTFCPMVFLSDPAEPGEHYWEKKLPVRALIEALLKDKPGFRNVLFTDSPQHAAEFLIRV